MSDVTAADYEEVLADHRRLVRELDVLLNGEGAAPQASLCDIVSQVKSGGLPLQIAVKTAHQALIEVAAAQERGASWYTHGDHGLYRQVAMWVRKGLGDIAKVPHE